MFVHAMFVAGRLDCWLRPSSSFSSGWFVGCVHLHHFPLTFDVSWVENKDGLLLLILFIFLKCHVELFTKVIVIVVNCSFSSETLS